MTDQPQEPSKPPEPNRAASGCLILILVLVIPGAIFLIRGDDQSADSPTTTTRDTDGRRPSHYRVGASERRGRCERQSRLRALPQHHERRGQRHPHRRRATLEVPEGPPLSVDQ
jgi:hypothetical protein